MERKQELEILMKDVKWHIQYHAKEFGYVTSEIKHLVKLKEYILMYENYDNELKSLPKK